MKKSCTQIFPAAANAPTVVARLHASLRKFNQTSEASPPRPHEQRPPRTCFVGPAMCAPSLSLEPAAGLLVFSASADDDV